MKSLVVRMKFGSHLYGTNTPASDLDYKSIYLPDAETILLQRVKGSMLGGREKVEGERNTAKDVDDDTYSLQRYLSLLVDGQTVALDMLFAPPDMWISSSALWDYIRSNKAKFLTKRSLAFVGYCRQQANKYGIKGSRVSAAKQTMEVFANAMAELGTQAKVSEVEKELQAIQGDHVQIVMCSMDSTGKLGPYLECCNRKVAFTNNVKHAYEIYSKIYENYGARARQAETNEGVDWKALSHAVRVGEEALELLRTGNITLPLVNAQHILEIKQGKVEYAIVAKEIETLLQKIELESAASSLPENADLQFVDDLVLQAHLDIVMEAYETRKILCSKKPQNVAE